MVNIHVHVWSIIYLFQTNKTKPCTDTGKNFPTPKIKKVFKRANDRQLVVF